MKSVPSTWRSCCLCQSKIGFSHSSDTASTITNLHKGNAIIFSTRFFLMRANLLIETEFSSVPVGIVDFLPPKHFCKIKNILSGFRLWADGDCGERHFPDAGGVLGESYYDGRNIPLLICFYNPVGASYHEQRDSRCPKYSAQIHKGNINSS